MRSLLLSFSLLLVSLPLWAKTPAQYSHDGKTALKGFDVVAYYSLPAGANALKGKPGIEYEWQGLTWYFANAANRQAFVANPAAYAPQYGGYCAFAVAHGFTTSPRVNSWKVVDGKLYLNNNPSSFKLWEKDQSNKIAQANQNWPAVLHK